MQASYKGLANFVQQWEEKVFVSSDVALGLLVGVSGWGAGIPAMAAGRAFAGRHWDVGELPKSSAGTRASIRRIFPPLCSQTAFSWFILQTRVILLPLSGRPDAVAAVGWDFCCSSRALWVHGRCPPPLVRGVSPRGRLCCRMGRRRSGSGGCRDSRSFSFHPAERFEGDEAVRRERYPPPLLGQKRLKRLLPSRGSAPASPLAGAEAGGARGCSARGRPRRRGPQLGTGLWSLLAVRPSVPPGGAGGCGGPEPSDGSTSGCEARRVRRRFLAAVPVPHPEPGSLPPHPAASPLETSTSFGTPGEGGGARASPPSPRPALGVPRGRGAPALAGEVPPRPPPRAAAAAAEPRQGDYEDVSRSGGRREGRRAPDEVLGEPRRVIHVRPCVCV